MSDPVPSVARAMNTIQNRRLAEKAAAQAVIAHERWLGSPEGREALLRIALGAGYRIGLERQP